jgi:hypothetical protein
MFAHGTINQQYPQEERIMRRFSADFLLRNSVQARTLGLGRGCPLPAV